MAHEADAEFMHVKAEDVSGQGLYGQSEQAVSGIFTAARQANAAGKHVIVFLDEGDLLLPGKTATRGGRHEATGKTVGIFAQEMDGLVSSPKITLVISTNDPQDIDPRILSRMDEMAGLNLPSAEGIARIMKLHFEKIERSVGHKLVDEAVYSGQLPSLAYSEEMSGRDVADAIGMLIRQRGQKQLSKIREAIESGRIVKNKEEDEASAIGRVARALSAGTDEGLDYLKLPPIKAEELRRALLTSKGLNRKKEEVRFGFLAGIPYKDSGNSLRAPYARIGGETRLIE
jgi:SpoVK/Ycf46/Vps4 family AAA+-type ATPase